MHLPECHYNSFLSIDAFGIGNACHKRALQTKRTQCVPSTLLRNQEYTRDLRNINNVNICKYMYVYISLRTFHKRHSSMKRSYHSRIIKNFDLPSRSRERQENIFQGTKQIEQQIKANQLTCLQKSRFNCMLHKITPEANYKDELKCSCQQVFKKEMMLVCWT